MFTWCVGLNNRSKSRIDRFLISEDWKVHFQGAIQVVLAKSVSDHSPILLDGGGMRRRPTPFRFENMWLKEDGFKEVLRQWWEGIQASGSASFILTEKLKALKPLLRNWNKEVFGQIDCEKQKAWILIDYWDKEKRGRCLSMEEEEARRRQESYIRSEPYWKKCHGGTSLGKSGLKRGTKTPSFFIKWQVLTVGGIN